MRLESFSRFGNLVEKILLQRVRRRRCRHRRLRRRVRELTRHKTHFLRGESDATDATDADAAVLKRDGQGPADVKRKREFSRMKFLQLVLDFELDRGQRGEGSDGGHRLVAQRQRLTPIAQHIHQIKTPRTRLLLLRRRRRWWLRRLRRWR